MAEGGRTAQPLMTQWRVCRPSASQSSFKCQCHNVSCIPHCHADCERVYLLHTQHSHSQQIRPPCALAYLCDTLIVTLCHSHSPSVLTPSHFLTLFLPHTHTLLPPTLCLTTPHTTHQHQINQAPVCPGAMPCCQTCCSCLRDRQPASQHQHSPSLHTACSC